MPILHLLFQKLEREGTLPKLLDKVSTTLIPNLAKILQENFLKMLTNIPQSCS